MAYGFTSEDEYHDLKTRPGSKGEKAWNRKGAEICGVSRAEFLRILGEYKVSVIQYDEESLDRELA